MLCCNISLVESGLQVREVIRVGLMVEIRVGDDICVFVSLLDHCKDLLKFEKRALLTVDVYVIS